jgi:hypothetical protein
MNAIQKTAAWKAKVRELRSEHPNIGFVAACARVAASDPELFSDEGEPVGEGPKRSWQELPPSNQGRVRAGEPKTPFLDLLAVCRQMKIPVLVQAEAGDGPVLEISDQDGRLLREWVELQGYELVEVL